MRFTYFLFLFIISIVTSNAQTGPGDIRLRTGRIAPFPSFQKNGSAKSSLQPVHFGNKYFALFQFRQIPGQEEKNRLAQKGIFLYDYIPGNSYMVEMPDSISQETLRNLSITGIYPLSIQEKIAPRLQTELESPGPVESKILVISFFGSQSKEEVTTILKQNGATIVPSKIQPKQVVFIHASRSVLQRIGSLPFVSFINEQFLKDVPLNYNNHAAYSIDALDASSGRNLLGNNVAVGVGDNADPSSHIDFNGRLINRTPAPLEIHGTHTTGTTGGGGLLNPMYKGMAPMATLISQYYSDILVNAGTYITDYNMVLTNNSYYSGNAGCAGEGEYDVLANFLDDLQNTDTSLLNVFAAGNDGQLTCTPYPLHFATIKSGFQCAKNVLSVGADTSYNHLIWYYSSRGPASDGRVKPEIVAGGVGVISTFPFYGYGSDNGTSMACPTVTGALALLYQRYRQLHNGMDPSSALIKAITCNSADDLGNPGPDFTWGFGKLNARTAVETMENNQYFQGSISNQASTNFTINNIPAGASQIKIMLYWADPAATPNAATALVNNLDLTVTGSDGITHYPLVLDASPAGVNKVAVEGIDSLNNIEQVIINTPPAGSLTVHVNGTNIPMGPQKFWVVYQVITPSVTVEYPFGSETWVPGQTEKIRWSAYGTNGNTFSIDYSLDNGSTWSNISSNVPDSIRYYSWVVPSVATNQALIRVTCNNLGFKGTSQYPFTILGQPVITVTNPCQGYASIIWNKIPSATSYQVMLLKGDSMQPIANITDTSYLLQGLNRDSTYWLTARAMNNQVPGRRAVAASIIPSGGPCTIFNKDFTVDSLVSPLNGRQYTSTQLTQNNPLSVEIKNLGSLASSGPFTLSYQVNGGNIVTETSNAILAPNSALNYTFATTVDFSAPGTYNTRIWLKYPGDTLSSNDTLTVQIKQLRNDTLTLTPSFTEGFESADAASYTLPARGFIGLDRCDFNYSNPNGRIRTFVNSGFARTGLRCATLDCQSYANNPTADSLLTTFNLSNCKPGDQVWLNFYYKNQGINFGANGNQVWVRGNDQSAWIPILTLSSQASSIGVYLPSGNINLTSILASANPSQQFSSSFQIKFGEEGFTSSNSVIPDGSLDNGYSFDDITFTKPTVDIALQSLIGPKLTNICGLGNAETITIMVKNYTNSNLINIPVSYSINGNTVNETIPVLNALDSVQYSFTHTADLSAFQNYTLNTWVSYPGDQFHANDSLLNINFQTSPVISNYPYLEGFENNSGYWFTNGINDSWQWGTPQKQIIRQAANGNKCWVTSLNGNYNNNELSYLYSPCFDLSSLHNPVLSFSHVFQTEDDCDCDYHWAEYSLDDSIWTKLGSTSSGTNWYEDSVNQTWQLSDTIWHVSSYNIPTTAAKVRFRIVMSSDAGTNYEGVGIDDIHVFDKAPVYAGPSLDTTIIQNLSGSNWINFAVDSSMVASINPNGQNLGNTIIRLFRDTGSVRHTINQYYLNRNLVIQPASQPSDTVSVRFYFTDAEANGLIHASGCATCTSIHDAYQSGITGYSNAPLEEDSSLSNNVHGVYSFNPPHRRMSIIPNDNGYYAEYQVTHFSEFWINGGGPTQDQSLGSTLLTFTATQIDSTGLLQWSTLDQQNIDSFLVEKSTDSVHFIPIGEVAATRDTGTNHYQFVDTSLVVGQNYYQLVLKNTDSSIQYSPVVSILYAHNLVIMGIYPNPVIKGTLYVNTNANCNSIQVSDVSGRIISTYITSGTQNKVPMGTLSKGIYLVTVLTDNGRQVAKILVL